MYFLYHCFALPKIAVLFLVLFQNNLVVNARKKMYENYTPPCNDTSSECKRRILQSATPIFMAGFDKYGLEVLDPYYIENLDVGLIGGLNIQLREGRAKGLRKCIVDAVSIVDDTLETQFHCNLTIKGKYRSRGRLLMFPVNGDGESMVKCVNIRIHNTMRLGHRTAADGQKYMVIKSTTTDHSYDGRVSYNLTNLFKGSPEASKAVLNFMNQNWQMIAQEFGGPFVDFGVSNVIRNVERLFNIVPLDKLIRMDF